MQQYAQKAVTHLMNIDLTGLSSYRFPHGTPFTLLG
jgi:hypothetical protein